MCIYMDALIKVIAMRSAHPAGLLVDLNEEELTALHECELRADKLLKEIIKNGTSNEESRN